MSTYSLFDVVHSVAGESVELFSIIPAGTDIHSFEPTPKTAAKIEDSDIVFYNGAGLEPWIGSFEFKSRSIAMANFVKLHSMDEDTEHEHHEHEHSAHCSHSEFDPHIWFDVENMKKITEVVTRELITLKPENSALYLERQKKYVAMLDSIDAAYDKALSGCKLHTIITDHNAFSYLSEKYGFEIETLSGVSPDAEASPKDIIRIMEDVKEHNVSILFFEDFGNDRAMKSIAAQTKVELDSLHPLGNLTKDDVKNNRSYESIMLQNLEKLTKALQCR